MELTLSNAKDFWLSIIRIHIFDRPKVIHIFHWNNSNGLLVGLWTVFIAMVSMGKFGWAYFFCICAFAWSIGSWLTSDYVQSLSKQTKRQKRGLAVYSRRPFLKRKWIGIGLLSLVFCGCLMFIDNSQTEEELRQFAGKLQPANEPTPISTCGNNNLPKEYSIIFYGNGNSSATKRFPHDIVASATHGTILGIDKLQDGTLAVIMDLRSSDGKIIAKMGEDGFEVNPQNIMRMKRPNKSTLIVEDQLGRAMSIRYLNKRAISVEGSFMLAGQNVTLNMGNFTNFCTQDSERDILVP